jgi:hypothetical protein
MAMVPLVALLLLGPLWGASAVLLSSRPGNVHTLILTDCHKYQDWQTIAAAYAWRDSGQPGSVTRVANCDEKDTATYPKEMLDYVQTHMAPQVRHRGWDLCCRLELQVVVQHSRSAVSSKQTSGCGTRSSR